MKVLVSWYGAFYGNGTIGDLLSVQSLTNHLYKCGHSIHCTSYKDFPDIPAKIVNWQDISPSDYDAFIFVCGPILKHHQHLPILFDKFRDSIKIGIGVSIFPKNHFNHYNPFNYVLAREGMLEIYDDIAILASERLFKKNKARKANEIILGISLRGAQGEYGTENCLNELVDNIVYQSVACLVNEGRGRVTNIENHIEKSGLYIEDIENKYANCDLIITTRLHGAILATRHLVPFIAIDQIKGGAKVYNILNRYNWLHVYKSEQISVELINSVAGALLNRKPKNDLNQLKNRMKYNALTVLARLDNLLESIRQTTSI